LRDGVDPLAERRKLEQERELARESQRTFAEVAELVMGKNRTGWKGSEKSTTFAAWTRSLERDAKQIRNRPIGEITVDEVRRGVAPLWEDKGHYIAARMSLNRIEAVFGYAIAMGWRTSDNPASWKKVFTHIAPDRPKVGRGAKTHHPMLPWAEAPAVVGRLRQNKSMSATLLEFLILTATRLSEGREAKFDEFNFDKREWSIPGIRTKTSRPHVVPLSDRALEIVTALHAKRGRGKLVFPGDPPSKPLNPAAIWSQCRHKTEGRASPHGWRATMRSWMADRGVEFEVAECILGHVGGPLKQAYQRSDMVPRRRVVMDDWSRFLSGESETAEVVAIGSRRRR
jgi:integrase